MSFQERRRKILLLIHEFENLSVAEIAVKTGSSPATVRRDLTDLAEEGSIVRTHGGAMKPDDGRFTGFDNKQQANNEVKQAIGKLAALSVKDGDTIFMDCGSTVFMMCAHLKKMNKVRIITNSLPVVAEMMDAPGISINIIGGELDAGRKAVHGDTAIAHIDNYHADKAFIGIDGITLQGLSSHSEKEATITKAFCRNASSVYLLCDSLKIGKPSYIKTGPLTIINHLLTDTSLSEELRLRIAETGIDVQVTENL